ncbi:phage holin family protein [Clostridium butyricum]|uniref:Holin n=1 Tax=Clostridium butyricum TaxID=1492 RepID=A0A2S7FD46_CLOBU|nr:MULTISPECIES: phage holin family protein [Clostridium]ETI88626.1 MAG: Phage holin [Clostridium butyricum DORA_1]APF22802.1 putative membrane protein [Clostridium butyricum]KHD16041.1 holin [Clostridium butyricum]MBS5982397.1 phage holin family protein [Clostridium butyricum]MBZ0313359.1 phage holin family protein [Clostridium butyricum]
MDVSQYITQNALILIPVLYIIGMIIKNTDKISDKYIPLILLVFGIAGSMGIIGLNANAVIQGVLVTGATVYTNQLIKQTGKDK